MYAQFAGSANWTGILLPAWLSSRRSCLSHSHSTLPWFVFEGYLTQSRPASHMPSDSTGIPGHPHVTAAEGNADAVETCTDVKMTWNKRRNGANSWKLNVNSKTPRLRAVINSLPGHVAPQTPRTSRVWSSADNFTESGWRICYLKHSKTCFASYPLMSPL